MLKILGELTIVGLLLLLCDVEGLAALPDSPRVENELLLFSYENMPHELAYLK